MMALELRRRLGNLVGPGRKKFFNDDFNWDTYTKRKYGPQLKQIEATHLLRIDDRVSFDRVAGDLVTGDANLHPNAKSVYEVIGILEVRSVLEVGCGGGDHIRNLKLLYPNLVAHGGDRSEEQLKLLRERNPEIADCTFLQDITMPLSSHWPRVELVFSQAVIMHIKTATTHLSAMANMFNLAQKYVVMMENFGCHPFVKDIRRLHEGGHLNWEQVHFHVHHAEGKPHCLIAAREPCSLPILEDYFELPCARKIRY